MKVKHKYKVHHLLPGYPTEEDLLFEIVEVLTERGKLEEEWSIQGIRNAVHSKNSTTIEEMQNLLDSLCKQGNLSKSDSKKPLYKVQSHSF